MVTIREISLDNKVVLCQEHFRWLFQDVFSVTSIFIGFWKSILRYVLL